MGSSDDGGSGDGDGNGGGGDGGSGYGVRVGEVKCKVERRGETVA
jgi:hypothetical protein